MEAGLRELTGARNLISQYRLMPHHDFFCKRSHPGSVSDTHYLYNVVGDREVRKGEGLQLNQLMGNAFPKGTNVHIQPFGLDVLGEAFQLSEKPSVDLHPSAKAAPTFAGKIGSEAKDKKKHKKQHKKCKHCPKDRGK